MTHIHSPRIPQIPLLLLLEPTQLRKSERAMQIGASGFEIIRANDASGIYLMHGKLQLAFAVLSDVVGCVSLRACAETVRWNWPKARILILGRAPYEFEEQAVVARRQPIEALQLTIREPASSSYLCSQSIE